MVQVPFLKLRKTDNKSSLDRVNRQLSTSRSTFRQRVNVGVLVATVALVAYGAAMHRFRAMCSVS